MDKTCGTCAQCLPVVGHCDERNDTVDLNEEACRDYKERDVTKAYTADGKEILTFAGVKLIEAYDRIVKYEQLEQVAKKMLSWCDQVMTHYSGDGGTPEDVSAFRDKLKALGVRCDGMLDRTSGVPVHRQATRRRGSHKAIP